MAPLDQEVDLISMEDTRFLHCNIKTLNLLPSVMAAQKAAERDCFETVFHRGDVVKQADRLFTNISKLLEDDGATLADMAYYIVYLRDVADAATISRYMAERYPHTPYLITEARVCRPEWLIEVEGIATD